MQRMLLVLHDISDIGETGSSSLLLIQDYMRKAMPYPSGIAFRLTEDGFSRAPIGYSMLSDLERILYRQFQDALCRSTRLVIEHAEVIDIAARIIAVVLTICLAGVI